MEQTPLALLGTTSPVPTGNRYLFLYSIGAAGAVAVVYYATSGREG